MRTLLYDFDGLLIDSESAGFVSWQQVYTSHGQALDAEWWLAEVAAGRGPCMPTAALEALLGEPVDWDTVEARRLAHRNELIVPRPGVLAHLARARELGLACAIVSNAPDWWIDEQLDHTGIDRGQFSVIVTKSPDRARKPEPDAYLAALRELGADARDALAFEDSPIGIAAAKAAGIRCVAVPNEVTGRLSLAEADRIVPSLADVSLDELLSELDSAHHGSSTIRPTTSPAASARSARSASASE